MCQILILDCNVSWSQPDSLSINTTALKTNGSNSIPHYTQFYEVRNVGPSDVVSGRFRIVFPTHTPEGYSINELTAQPTVNGSATCDTVSIASRAQETAGIDINCEFGRMARNARAVIILMAKLSPEAFLKVITSWWKFIERFVIANSS